MRPLAILVPALLLSACSVAVRAGSSPDAAEMRFITPPEGWPYPFSPAVRVGNLIYLSGQLGTRVVDGRPVLAPGGVEAETRQALENVRAIVEQAGSSMERVAR